MLSSLALFWVKILWTLLYMLLDLHNLPSFSTCLVFKHILYLLTKSCISLPICPFPYFVYHLFKLKSFISSTCLSWKLPVMLAAPPRLPVNLPIEFLIAFCSSEVSIFYDGIRFSFEFFGLQCITHSNFEALSIILNIDHLRVFPSFLFYLL